MKILGAKSIDELGRIIVPKEVRQAKGWAEGDKIAFCSYNGIIVIESFPQVHELEQIPDMDKIG
ncbi:MAG: AbrB/MazE/SpoVT family DNA-binding domain-containing protein [Defluviitaleaceae bacterium]|nr:AbrB/MazE/SpoVT family DNA-binding domain-containing protein [Defluviitaleaceae bacterium]